MELWDWFKRNKVYHFFTVLAAIGTFSMAFFTYSIIRNDRENVKILNRAYITEDIQLYPKGFSSTKDVFGITIELINAEDARTRLKI